MVDGKSLSLSFPFNQHWSEEDPFLSGVFQWERRGERGWGFLSSLDELRTISCLPAHVWDLQPFCKMYSRTKIVVSGEKCTEELDTVSQLLIVVGVTGFVFWHIVIVVVQTLCDSTDCNTPGSSVLHYVLEFAVHWVWFMSIESVMLSYHLILCGPPSPALSLSQHHSLFQRVNSSHQVGDILELQLQHQIFQWIFRVDFL